MRSSCNPCLSTSKPVVTPGDKQHVEEDAQVMEENDAIAMLGLSPVCALEPKSRVSKKEVAQKLSFDNVVEFQDVAAYSTTTTAIPGLGLRLRMVPSTWLRIRID